MLSRLFLLQSCANRQAHFRSFGVRFSLTPPTRSSPTLTFMTLKEPRGERTYGFSGSTLSGESELIVVGDYQFADILYE